MSGQFFVTSVLAITSFWLLSSQFVRSSLADATPAAPPTLPADSAEQAAQRVSLEGSLLFRDGKILQALPKFEAALEIYQQLHKEQDHPDVARSLSSVAFCLNALHRSGEALPKFQAALAMRLRLSKGRDDPAVAISFNNVAGCLDSMGRSAESLPNYEAALSMCLRLYKEQDHSDVATSLNNVGFCLNALGRPSEALPKYEAALAMRLRLSQNRDDPDVARSLNNMAACLQALGRLTDALPKYESALAMELRLYKDQDRPDVATSLNNVAFCLNSLGRSGEALPKAEAALAMRLRLSQQQDDPAVASSLNNIALCLSALGRPREAFAKFEAALAMDLRLHGDQDHPAVARSLNNVAGCLNAFGRSGEALPKYERALAMYVCLYKDQDHPDVAISLNNVAACLHALSRTGEALPKFQAALAMRLRLSRDQDHPDVAMALNNFAACLDSVGRTGEALAKYEAALAMLERLGDANVFRCACNIATLQTRMGRFPDAARSFQKAIDGLDSSRQKLGGSDQDRMNFFAVAREWGPFEGMLRVQLACGRADEALQYAERGKARSLLDVLERGDRLRGGDLLSVVESKARAGRQAELLAAVEAARRGLREAQSESDQLAAEISLARNRGDLSDEQRRQEISALEDSMRLARERVGDAQRIIFNLAGEHASSDLKPATALQLQQILRGEERMLIYTVSSTDAVLLVVSPPGKAIRGVYLKWANGRPLDAASLSAGVEAYRSKMLADRGSTRGQKLIPSTQPDLSHPAEDTGALGRRLFEALVPPDAWADVKKAGRVYVVPDGAMHRLPLEMLVVASDESADRSSARRHYWIDDGPAVVYGPSATALLNRRKIRDGQLELWAKGERPARLFVGLGDPIFSRNEPSARAAPPEHGLLVMSVEAGSIGEKIGLGAASVIAAYGGETVTDVAGFDAVLDKLLVRQRHGQLKAVPLLRFWRDGKWVESEVSPRDELGASLAELTPERVAKLATGRAVPLPRQVAVARGGYADRYGALPPLPGTGREVRAIFRTITGQDYETVEADRPSANGNALLLLREQATAPHLADAAAGARYLHLATHGLVETGDQAVYSSLALTQPRLPTPDDSGFLTLSDLFDHWWGKLAGTELVVLSACESQGDDASGGNRIGCEGVFGLPWGFMYAGSPAVVCSLWDVDDDSTADLMSDFYARLRLANESDSKLDAFVAARRACKAKHPEPYYWAPFIYLGDPR